ncbi:MAG: TetR family transcriptional regulator [Actinomycetaceae bacterium]|nr:TetR family transcriptional regulator [Actinomycetaceae bacterium]
MDRRADIARAGIRLIAAGGTHALTHRQVDREAGLPAGSTSYYARTRRDLVRLVCEQLSLDGMDEAGAQVIPQHLSVEKATDMVVALMETMAGRREAQAARFALMFEVRDDPELRAQLTSGAQVRLDLEALACDLLQAIGVRDADRAAPTFVATMDALLMYQAVEAAPIDMRDAVHAYLKGLCD